MSLDLLLQRAGEWRGSSVLEDPERGIADRSESRLRVASVLDGRFVRLDYSWAYRDEPQEGSLLVGFDPGGDAVSAHWIDSWHLGRTAMTCAGEVRADVLVVRGTYRVPGHPDWGWRTDVDPRAADALAITMYNVSPDGQEYLAVTAEYVRA